MKLQESINNNQGPYLITGPCSAETPDQLMQVCVEIAQNKQANLLRAGIWKPRTRPDSFEGVGAIGLPWLVEAGKACGLPTTTEIANAHHANAALKAGVDVLWIGARTTVNPFAVQEIADALKGVDIPVMVKNPVNPDLELWIGAFERLEKAGIKDLAAIHRGFSFYKHPKYRNAPNWEIPMAFRQRCQDIPMICDPSHIAGKRDLLLEICQKAMDLNYDGLMIETHPDPLKAWSDASQQVTPKGLGKLLMNLVLRSSESNETIEQQLQEFRDKIELLDDRLFDILSSRMNLSKEVGEFKRLNNITIYQQEHWAKVISKRMSKSEDYQLTERFIRQAMDAIHQESIRHQTKVMNPNLPNSETP
ncbi:MAG: bifunctional 3-deoxy-7-phosphoheptulonate synthase/chorismate mutase type II [Bacteroidetes bacterium]|nr:bifunctional 3-deoxy-7-phosphoheptulonate synthase/chorismate mutase type II [Bacteroidota bacterium]